MNRLTKYFSLIGFAAICGLSNAAYAECSFGTVGLPQGATAPDRVTDLSGQGNFICGNIIGSNGLPMEEVTEVIFQRNGDWELPEDDWVKDSNGYVLNTPDDIFLFPQGNGSRCNFSYLRNNAVKGALLSIDGNVDANDSIACTDNVVNVEEVIIGQPEIFNTEEACDVTIKVDGTIVNDDFDVFIGTNVEGDKKAICDADSINGGGKFCLLDCPEFIDIDALQADNKCLPNTNGTLPLTDPNTGQRCTPCLTAAQAEDTIAGYDADGLQLCWEFSNRVNLDNGTYRPHKPVRSETALTNFYNDCYETTVTINFFGRLIPKTITTCD